MNETFRGRIKSQEVKKRLKLLSENPQPEYTV